jgi:large subunit ribosomal protein L13
MVLSKTPLAKAAGNERKWIKLDAEGQILGRLATRISTLLRGKDKVDYTPHLDHGTGVIVTNAGKVKVTGKKSEQKIYTTYSGYPSGLKKIKLEDQLVKHPHRVIEHAVRGMLPHNRLGRTLMTRLRVYTTSEHPHQAQFAVSSKKASPKKDSKSSV